MTDGQQPAVGALSGVRVLDVSEGIAGPYATSMLADLGADVIKLERPEGDWARFVGRPVADGLSAMYVAMNRSKSELTLDLKNKAALALTRDLVRTSDVIVSNFRAGVMERLGLAYDDCQALRADIVYCTITAFDTRERYGEVGGNDTGLQAISGFMSTNGEPDGEPLRAATPVIDMVCALFTSQAIMAALRLPDEDPGRRVEVSLINAAAALQTLAFTEYLNTGELPVRQGNQNPFIAPAGAFAGSDGDYFTISCLKERHWAQLCAVIERPDLPRDPRFADNGDRVQNRAALNEALGEVFAARPGREWVRLLQDQNVLCAAINDFQAVTDDPGLASTLPVIEVGTEPPLVTIGHPARFGGSFPAVTADTKRIGADTRSTLARLGYGEEDIEALRTSGAVVCADPEPSIVTAGFAAGQHHDQA